MIYNHLKASLAVRKPTLEVHIEDKTCVTEHSGWPMVRPRRDFHSYLKISTEVDEIQKMPGKH